MKPEQYNPKAREAFARSEIDVGVGLFKGIFLLFTVAPMTYLLKGAVDGTYKAISLGELLSFIGSPAYFLFLAWLALAYYLAHWCRKDGLRRLHEMEQDSQLR